MRLQGELWFSASPLSRFYVLCPPAPPRPIVTSHSPSVLETELTMSSNSFNSSPTADLMSSAQHKHDVATFAGAVGGSVGFLSVLALGLCISIRYRRRRARLREHRENNAYAEVFTAHDHGNMEEAQLPSMSQARPGPFVPRYFPGSVPASPPPYIADVPAYTTHSLALSLNRAGIPVTTPSAPPPSNVLMPAPSLSLTNRAASISSSYAERPPPTPSSEEAAIIFGPDTVEQDQSASGGVVGPLPTDSPAAEENDPMLSLDFHGSREESSEGGGSSSRATSERRRSSASVQSLSSDMHTNEWGTPSLTRGSLTGSSVLSHEELATPKRTSHLPPGLYPTLSTSTSLPSLYHPRPQRFISPSQPDLFTSSSSRPNGVGESTTVTYPILKPNRIPLPASIYESDVGSLESLARHDSRT